MVEPGHLDWPGSCQTASAQQKEKEGHLHNAFFNQLFSFELLDLHMYIHKTNCIESKI